VAVRLVSEAHKRTVCEALGVNRSSLALRLAGPGATSSVQLAQRHMARRIPDAERQVILDVLHSDRFVDLAVPQIQAQLLDEGQYLCSVSTMYRLLHANAEVKERRAIARHLVMIDIFSRLVVGWQVVRRSNAAITENFIRGTLRAEGIEPGEAALHSDRGTDMTAQVVCDLLDALGVTCSLSRPQVSDDNPYSEAQFKTLKYHMDFPERFGSLEDAKAFFAPSLHGTTTSAAIQGSRCSRPRPSTPAKLIPSSTLGTALCSRPTRQNRSDSSTAQPKRAELPKDVWINKPDLENAA
jgi:putative transposase